MNLNLPNLLSVYRLLAAPLLIFFMLRNQEKTFAAFLLLSLITDIADGYFARKENMVTRLGASLDSIGDLITLLISVYAAWHFHKGFILDYRILILIVLGASILQVIFAIIRYGKPSSFHTYLAKAAFIAQGIFLLTMFFYEPLPWLFYIAMVISLAEVIEELILVYLLDEWRTDVKGLYWLKRKSKDSQ